MTYVVHLVTGAFRSIKPLRVEYPKAHVKTIPFERIDRMQMKKRCFQHTTLFFARLPILCAQEAV